MSQEELKQITSAVLEGFRLQQNSQASRNVQYRYSLDFIELKKSTENKGFVELSVEQPFIFIDTIVLKNKYTPDPRTLLVNSKHVAENSMSHVLNNQACFLPNHPILYIAQYHDVSLLLSGAGMYYLQDATIEEKDRQYCWILRLMK